MFSLKNIEADKLFFYTNYQSKKGDDIFAHQKVAINFYWDTLDRQLRLQGEVKKVPRENSIAYFKSRPLESQVSGIVSHQSRDIESYDELKKRYDDLLKSATDENLECPEHWGDLNLPLTVLNFGRHTHLGCIDEKYFSEVKVESGKPLYLSLVGLKVHISTKERSSKFFANKRFRRSENQN